jgi:superfamily I DNA/RNA helicase
MNRNKLIIAAAGAGKTTFLVNEALKKKSERVLITTYTQANEAEIRKKIIEENLKLSGNACIPQNVTVQTWFSFLLQHGVRPFQGVMLQEKIIGLVLQNNTSAIFIPEANTKKHYFTSDLKIFSDKISKFAIKCNEKTNGSVIDRLTRIFGYIFIDEVQDLAGYDLELLKLLFKANSNSLLVGDPRQGTYSTNNLAKNKKFKKSAIINFFEDDSLEIETDKTSLITNYRCNEAICNLSNKLFADLPPTISGNTEITTHDGVFLVGRADVNEYLKTYSPVQLRDKSTIAVHENYRVMNFGESKGLSFDRVLIYPTKPILEWLKDNKTELAPTSRSKFYVALTRARYSIGIICENTICKEITGVNWWKPN